MRRLDRYVLRQFIQALLLGLLAFLVIFIVIDFFEKLGDYIDRDTPWLVVARLYLFKVPYITVLILPIAMLLASLFSLGRMSRDSELTAMLAAGVPLTRLLAPLFVFAALVSVGSYYFNDRVVTRTPHGNLFGYVQRDHELAAIRYDQWRIAWATAVDGNVLEVTLPPWSGILLTPNCG